MQQFYFYIFIYLFIHSFICLFVYLFIYFSKDWLSNINFHRKRQNTKFTIFTKVFIYLFILFHQTNPRNQSIFGLSITLNFCSKTTNYSRRPSSIDISGMIFHNYIKIIKPQASLTFPSQRGIVFSPIRDLGFLWFGCKFIELGFLWLGKNTESKTEYESKLLLLQKY